MIPAWPIPSGMRFSMMRSISHVEKWLFEEPGFPARALDDAVAVVSDDANWNAETASTLYGVITTESGERELKAEREASSRRRPPLSSIGGR